jgi:DNA repair exonuclease SbcCD ATPase subunit
MSVRFLLRNCAVLSALCLAALPVLAQQQQQQSPPQQTGDPVADAARKAREAKKNAPKPKKVYTDDDVKPATPSGEGTAANPQQPAGGNATGGQESAGATTSGTGADAEATWRKRFKEQRDKIARAEKELDLLQRELEKATVQYYPDPQKALQEQNTRKDINEKTAKIEAKKQEIANLKQQLDDMEDELRKSGGDPGWARE